MRLLSLERPREGSFTCVRCGIPQTRCPRMVRAWAFRIMTQVPPGLSPPRAFPYPPPGDAPGCSVGRAVYHWPQLEWVSDYCLTPLQHAMAILRRRNWIIGNSLKLRQKSDVIKYKLKTWKYKIDKKIKIRC